MLRGRGRRFHLLNHIHGLPYDPPRWGERPRLRPKPSLPQGAGTTVAVLDSGAGEHPWLLGSFVEDPLPDAARELWDLSSDVLPRQVGHGTFVCGVILQYAPRAKLLPRRVIDMHGDAFDEELAAVVRSLIPKNPDVVNLSLGPTPADRKGETDEGVAHTMAALADLQSECGTVVVSAAGDINEELPGERLAPPGQLSLIVGALDLSGQPAWFSGVKPVTIWAPGVDVLSSFVHHGGPVSLAQPGDHEHDEDHDEDHADDHAGDHADDHADTSAEGQADGHTDQHTDGHTDEPADGAEPSEQPPAPFAGWARWNGTSFAAPAVSGAIAAEISALARAGDGLDRRELRALAVQRVLDRARPLPDGAPAADGGAVTGVALTELPVVLLGPPGD
jgi:subtilisin family serine protease